MELHTEHRDVIHDVTYDYYGQVSASVVNFRAKFLTHTNSIEF